MNTLLITSIVMIVFFGFLYSLAMIENTKYWDKIADYVDNRLFNPDRLIKKLDNLYYKILVLIILSKKK